MRKFIRRFLLLFILVVGISTAVIYTTVDINTLQNLNQFQPWSLALALCAIALGMFFDGSRLMHLVRISNERITLYQAVQVIFGNYFLALLTPGATAEQLLKSCSCAMRACLRERRPCSSSCARCSRFSFWHSACL